VLVFVYGTLKKNHSNHYHCLRDATFVGYATTKERYSMVDVGFPVLLTPGEGHPVRGEVYEVNSETLKGLDALESAGYVYDRVRKYVRMDDGTSARVYYYVGRPDYWEKRRGASPVTVKAGLYDWGSRV